MYSEVQGLKVSFSVYQKRKMLIQIIWSSSLISQTFFFIVASFTSYYKLQEILPIYRFGNNAVSEIQDLKNGTIFARDTEYKEASYHSKFHKDMM